MRWISLLCSIALKMETMLSGVVRTTHVLKLNDSPFALGGTSILSNVSLLYLLFRLFMYSLYVIDYGLCSSWGTYYPPKLNGGRTMKVDGFSDIIMMSLFSLMALHAAVSGSSDEEN